MIIKKANPCGFCSGVKGAITKVINLIEDQNIEKPLYILGYLVHNRFINDALKTKKIKVITEEDIFQIKKGTVILTAHGTPKKTIDLIKSQKLNLVDATCPKVKHIHKQIEKYIKDDYQVLFLGVKNHPETKAITSNYNVSLITLDDLSFSKEKSKLVLISQSTLYYLDYHEVYKKLTSLGHNITKAETICNATYARQKAVIDAKDADLVIVVGDTLSNNTKMLAIVAKKYNNVDSIRIENIEDLNTYDLSKYKNILVTAGASTPSAIINEVLDILQNKFDKKPYKSLLNLEDYLKF
ncbi:MAG: 4-hydroxy-3-methylbut-2-enyl diphosphate reductase [Bacilli bacterium]|nr:4-hydroxy-3-methylbut-2-enyl diphosphate reductase [Bacilli bacterium]MDD3623114.1 4-hydroxy-3-methylbut-2-enyl diphosphate reductase [Bacilli bacterium]